MIKGVSFIDPNILWAEIEFKNEIPAGGNVAMKEYLKRFIDEASNDGRKMFVHFCTSLVNMRCDGKLYNSKTDKIEPIKIFFLGVEQEVKIFGHTCFFTMDLGVAFKDYEEFAKQLGFVLREDFVGGFESA